MKTDGFICGLKKFYRDESGITGLETAIILIAFIVVAAVFAFTIMTTGLFSTEKAKTTAQAGISEASSTFAMKGSVTATSNDTGGPGQPPAPNTQGHITSVKFQVTLAAGAEDVDITLGNLAFILTHPDHVHSAAGGAAMTGGIMTGVARTTITGTDDNLLTSGEVVEFEIALSLTHNIALHVDKTFRIEIIPPKGASLILERKSPNAMHPVMILR